LWHRNGLVIYVAARLDQSGQPVGPGSVGLGAALVVCGGSVVRGCLLVGDDVAETDAAGFDSVRAWAAAHPLGRAPWQVWHVATVSDFFDPEATVERQPWAFTPNAYTGAGFVIGADLGRTFGLVANHVSPRRGKNRGSWEVWLPGWGREWDDGWRRVSPHRPALRVKARRVGWQVEFGPCTRGFGKVVGGRAWRGRFVDVISLGYAFDGQRGCTFAEHAENFGLAPVELPLAVPVDADGAAKLVEAVEAIHALAVKLDEQAGRWFTTPRDRNEGRGRIDLARTVSPAALPDRLLTGFGVKAPLDVWRLSAAELEHWAETFHGGRCDANAQLLGQPFGAVTADVKSCYPLMGHRLDWWRMMTAASVRRRSVTTTLRQLSERSATDASVALDPQLWRRFGVTLVEVEPDGEPFPVALEDRRRPDGRLEVVPVSSRGRTLFYAWPDVLAAAVLSGRAPRIVSATRYEPVGRQKARPRVAVLPGLVVGSDVDPVLALVLHRGRAKRRGDLLLAVHLRVITNALVFGLASRTDEEWVKVSGKWTRAERPGPWSCFPIASSVTAGARLLLAVLERLISDAGGLVGYMDTDSAIIPASPAGGKLTLVDGSTGLELAWPEVDAVLARFERLALPDWPVWETKRGTIETPLQALVFGPKRHVESIGDGLLDALDTEVDPENFDATEANLGGTYADPPALRGRVAVPDGYRRWSMAVVRREADLALARAKDPDALRSSCPAAWDDPNAVPFPAIRRLMVKTPAMAYALHACLGARPGTRYIEMSGRDVYRGQEVTVVALDPGGDLSEWDQLSWVVNTSGEPVRVTTDPDDRGALSAEPGVVLVASLDQKGCDWSKPPRRDPISEVVVTPGNVRYVGRASAVIDADTDGQPGDPVDYRPTYGRECACGCGEIVQARRRDARYADESHRERAKKRRQRSGPGEF
jgi:hypothetical protein